MISKHELLQAKMQEVDEISFELTDADLASISGGQTDVGDAGTGGFAIRNATLGAKTGGFAVRNATLGGFAIRNATLA